VMRNAHAVLSGVRSGVRGARRGGKRPPAPGAEGPGGRKRRLGLGIGAGGRSVGSGPERRIVGIVVRCAQAVLSVPSGRLLLGLPHRASGLRRGVIGSVMLEPVCAGRTFWPHLAAFGRVFAFFPPPVSAPEGAAKWPVYCITPGVRKMDTHFAHQESAGCARRVGRPEGPGGGEECRGGFGCHGLRTRKPWAPGGGWTRQPQRAKHGFRSTGTRGIRRSIFR
jgi:hypothetical protein